VKILFILLISSCFAQNFRILNQSKSHSLREGQRSLLTVLTSLEEGITYQWYIGSDPIDGATSKSYQTDILKKSNQDKYSYTVVVTNGTQQIVSDEIKIFIKSPTSEVITLSGVLKDNANNIIPGNDIDLEISIFDVMTGGTSLYNEEFSKNTGNSVVLNHGEFVLKIGEGVSNTNLLNVVRDNSNLYIEFKLIRNKDPEVLSPRIPLTAVPFAIKQSANVLYGVGTPIDEKGAVGNHYVDESTGKTWVKTHAEWVLFKP
jgi:hypothetical protein